MSNPTNEESNWKAPMRIVKHVQFGILSPEEIRSIYVTEGGIRYPKFDERGKFY
jgi:DNA-directed RNA polymerase II subunit RPB1